MSKLPSAIYVWLVPSEEVQEQPGSWRIRKWDTAPFHEANFTLPASDTGPARDDNGDAVLVPLATLERWGNAISPYQTEGSYNNYGVIDTMAEMVTLATKAQRFATGDTDK